MIKLKEIRKENGKTQEDVSQGIGISRFTYCNYENGKTEAPYKVLKDLSDFFNVTIDQILDNNTKEKTVYNEKQKKAIEYLGKLNDLYLANATGYIKALLDDQERIERINSIKNKG